MVSIKEATRRRVLLGTTAALAGVWQSGFVGRSAADRTEAGEACRISACSFNVRYDNPDDDYPWSERLSRVAEAIDRLDPGLLGLQEVLANQYDDLRNTVKNYEWYGVGREDGDREGEFVPIAWRTDRFEAVETGEFWLSETPDEPSVGWDADLPRVTTWAHLRHRSTGTEVWFCNTHFSHVGREARIESARMIRERAAGAGVPPVVTGDFNVRPVSNPYHVLVDQTGAGDSPLADGRREADTTSVFGPWGTYHGFTGEIEDRIDYVFVPAAATVDRYRTVGVREGAYRSDHLPVVATFQL